MSELLDWAEKAGQENMRERIEVAGMIQREANAVMVLLLSGAGAALAFAGADHTAAPRLASAAVATSVYLFALAALLNWKCLGLADYPAAFNEPKNLNRPDYQVEQLRAWELDNLQARIGEASGINRRRSNWLNRCRYAATLTPVAALAGLALADLVADVALAVAALAAG